MPGPLNRRVEARHRAGSDARGAVRMRRVSESACLTGWRGSGPGHGSPAARTRPGQRAAAAQEAPPEALLMQQARDGRQRAAAAARRSQVTAGAGTGSRPACRASRTPEERPARDVSPVAAAAVSGFTGSCIVGCRCRHGAKCLHGGLLGVRAAPLRPRESGRLGETLPARGGSRELSADSGQVLRVAPSRKHLQQKKTPIDARV